MGCIMVRQCQSNTCPVGVCTQDEKLRAKFTGTADKVVNLITFSRRKCGDPAQIGARSLDEIGRADLLTQVARGGEPDDLDLNPMLISVDGSRSITYDRSKPRNAVPDTLDAEIIRTGIASSRTARRCSCPTPCGTRCGPSARGPSHIVKKFGMRNALQPDHLTVKLTGPAGSRWGRSACGAEAGSAGRCQRLCRQGPVGRHDHRAAADVLAAEGGGEHDHRQHRAVWRDRRVLFASGRAGERFGVRNSGARWWSRAAGRTGANT
jgi:glutamate synthase (NADPH/NADH) large chain/glutamate synthase (ferredoxin)